MPNSTALRLTLAAAVLVAVAAGFAIGHMTAASAPPSPAFAAARTSAAALALPQLSQAAPLPALRPRGAVAKTPAKAAPAVSSPSTTVASAKPAHTSKPAHKAPSHRVVGSG